MPTNSAHPLHKHRLSIIAALAGCLLFLVLVLVLHDSPAPVAADLTDVPASDQWKFTAEGRTRKLSEIRAQETGLATTYGWVDQTKGVVRLPIERAMELTVQDLQSRR